MNLYAKDGNGLVPISLEDSADANLSGMDIFYTPQEFPPGKRKTEDLIAIKTLCGDWDNVSLEDLHERLHWAPDPSRIVKTRSGFHVYWDFEPLPAKEDTPARYRALVEQHLIPLGADPNAKDVSRLLRAPGSMYWRDSKGNEYPGTLLCEMIENTGRVYTLKDLMLYMPLGRVDTPRTTQHKAPPIKMQPGSSSDFWWKVNNLDVRAGIMALSGMDCVRGERYEIKNDRVWLVGAKKSMNVWLTGNRIGSMEDAGPALLNWLMYYKHSKRDALGILKRLYPELEEKKEEIIYDSDVPF